MNPFGFYYSRSLCKCVVGTLSGLLDLSIAFNNYYLCSVILEIELYITSEIKMALWELERFCCGTYVESMWGDCLYLALVAFPFLPAVHILLIGHTVSALYGWNPELGRFSFILEAPSAHDAASVTVKSLNSSKNLIALVGATHSHMYELAYVSSLSDFIPR